jgi:hypothetical protein
VDYLKKVKDDLKKHGLSETETLFDPKTGRKLGDIMVGPHYTFQLEHQIDKKTHVRGSGMPGEIAKAVRAPHIFYDADTKIPRGGGKHGAQSPRFDGHLRSTGCGPARQPAGDADPQV